MKKLIFLTFLSLIFTACVAEETPGWPPVSRFTVSPAYVNTGESTEIVLDGRRSCDALDSPELCDNTGEGDGAPSTCPGGITYKWSIPGLEGDFLASNENNSFIRVSVNIDRPVRIELTVTDCDGNETTAYKWLGVTEDIQ